MRAYLSAAAIALATPALCDAVNLTHGAAGGDTAELEMHSSVFAVLTYHNTVLQHSTTGDWPLVADNLTCNIRIVIGDAEKVWVTCDEGWTVEPEYAEVPDGETFEFHVSLQAM